MPVKITYAGRFGNCLIEYWAARLFAERHCMNMLTPWNRPEHLQVKPTITYDGEGHWPEIIVTDHNFEEIMGMRAAVGLYHFKSYSQVIYLLEPYLDQIKSWMVLPRADPIDDDHIAMHVRLTDHGGGSLILSPQWYVDILEKESFKHLTIFTEDPCSYSMFEKYQKWNPTIVSSPNCMDDWHTMRRFQKIIIPNSSFSLTAVMMSENAKTIYQWARDQEPIPYIKHKLSRAIRVTGKYWRES